MRTDTTKQKIIRSIMDNFPEASYGCELRCTSFNYDKCLFDFEDSEGKETTVDEAKLLAAFDLMLTDKWPKGLTQPPLNTMDAETWDNWLWQADALDFDAFVQLAIEGEVIYG